MAGRRRPDETQPWERGRSWNVCSVATECQALVSMRREGPAGASTQHLTCRKAEFNGRSWTCSG